MNQKWFDRSRVFVPVAIDPLYTEKYVPEQTVHHPCTRHPGRGIGHRADYRGGVRIVKFCTTCGNDNPRIQGEPIYSMRDVAELLQQAAEHDYYCC